MSLSTIRSLIASGDLVLWIDCRSGHTANLAGTAVGDAGFGQSQGRLRSGRGFVTGALEDFEGVAEPTSVGYLKVPHDVLLAPPVGGCCVVASYVLTGIPTRAHLVGMGQYGTPASACWELLRDDRTIRFATSDGAAEDDFQYLIDPNMGGVETVGVRYTGGTGPNNCTIKVYDPAVSSSTGTIDKVPADVDIALHICSESGGELKPVVGTMRYVAFVRGAQTQDVLDDLVAELEGCVWQNDPMRFDRDGGVATRRLHYESRFGVDAQTVPVAAAKSEISNSGWILTETLDAGVDESGSALVDFSHHDNVALWTLPDIDKVLRNNWPPGWGEGYTTLHLPTTRMACTPAEAAYGTWDWWMYAALDPVEVQPQVGFWPVSSSPDHLAGYEVRVAATGTLSLQEWTAGVANQLATTAANIIPLDTWVHFRVTRTAAGVFKVFYDVGAGWVLAFTVTDVTVTTSECMVWGGGGTGSYNSQLGLGNYSGRRSVYKWQGVVLPI